MAEENEMIRRKIYIHSLKVFCQRVLRIKQLEKAAAEGVGKKNPPAVS